MKCPKLFLLFLLLLVACGKDVDNYKTCSYETADPVLQVYNDLLIELVENHFYNDYLGDQKEVVLRGYYKLENPDAADVQFYEEKLTGLRNELYGDSSRFQTIYLTSLPDPQQRFKDFLPHTDTAWASPVDSGSIRSLLPETEAEAKQAVSVLRQSQESYSAKDFTACTFSVDDLGDDVTSIFEFERVKKLKSIGQLAFSQIYWMNSGEGLLYYEYICNTKCGKGEFLSIKKVKGRWTIAKKIPFWTA